MHTRSSTKLDLDSTDDEHWFTDAISTLTEWLNDLNPESNTYTARGQNVGWRNQNGTTTVTVADGRDLIHKLTPNSDWSLTATKHDDHLEITLRHHDSPTGEIHTLTPN